MTNISALSAASSLSNILDDAQRTRNVGANNRGNIGNLSSLYGLQSGQARLHSSKTTAGGVLSQKDILSDVIPITAAQESRAVRRDSQGNDDLVKQAIDKLAQLFNSLDAESTNSERIKKSLSEIQDIFSQFNDKQGQNGGPPPPPNGQNGGPPPPPNGQNGGPPPPNGQNGGPPPPNGQNGGPPPPNGQNGGNQDVLNSLSEFLKSLESSNNSSDSSSSDSAKLSEVFKNLLARNTANSDNNANSSNSNGSSANQSGFLRGRPPRFDNDNQVANKIDLSRFVENLGKLINQIQPANQAVKSA